MVSLKKKFGVYFFVSALVLVCLLMPAELKASVPCCKNGKLSTCPDSGNGQSYDISGCMSISPIDPDKPIIIGPAEPIEQECTSGQTQYQSKGDCGTSTRTCCSNGSWSDWDGECGVSSSCGANQCWNGTICEDKPSGGTCTCSNGTCTLSYVCRNSVLEKGWREQKNCTCKTGYEKNSSGECVHSTCAKGCSVGQYLREKHNGNGECECCSPPRSDIQGHTSTDAYCTDYGIVARNKTCCRTQAYDGPVPIYYTLPSDFSTCEALGEAIQQPMYKTDCPNKGSL